MAPSPDNIDDLTIWRKTQLEMNCELDWGATNRFGRNIPGGPKIQPIFNANLPARLEKMALRWYLNRIPGSPCLTEVKEQLHYLLGKFSLT